MNISLNEFELKQYNKYSKLDDDKLDDILTEIFNECSRVNDCPRCRYNRKEYENVSCEQDIIALVDKNRS